MRHLEREAPCRYFAGVRQGAQITLTRLIVFINSQLICVTSQLDDPFRAIGVQNN